MGAHEVLGVFSDSQAITAAAASTNTIDLEQTSPKIGVGQHAPYLVIKIAVAPNAAAIAGPDSYSIELQTDADDGAGAPAGTWTNVAMIPLSGAAGAEVTVADARISTAGANVFIGQLPYTITNRHIRLYYNNTVTDGSTSFDAFLEDGPASVFRGSQKLFSNVGNP